MSVEEVADFLDGCHFAAIGTQDEDGFPIAALARISREGGDLVAQLDREDPVTTALQDGARACLAADTWPSYDTIRGVIVRGFVPASSDLSMDAVRLTSFDFAKAPISGQ
jgi:hypothetical protein